MHRHPTGADTTLERRKTLFGILIGCTIIPKDEDIEKSIALKYEYIIINCAQLSHPDLFFPKPGSCLFFVSLSG